MQKEKEDKTLYLQQAQAAIAAIEDRNNCHRVLQLEQVVYVFIYTRTHTQIHMYMYICVYLYAHIVAAIEDRNDCRRVLQRE